MSKLINTTDSRFTEWTTASGGSDGCLYASRANDGSGNVALWESETGSEGPITVLDDLSWRTFLTGAKSGVFDTI